MNKIGINLVFLLSFIIMFFLLKKNYFVGATPIFLWNKNTNYLTYSTSKKKKYLVGTIGPLMST